jgi:hypothetical protein
MKKKKSNLRWVEKRYCRRRMCEWGRGKIVTVVVLMIMNKKKKKKKKLEDERNS